MARRVVAFIAMIAVIVLAVLLMWRIHEHHKSGQPRPDEPTIVRLGLPNLSAQLS